MSGPNGEQNGDSESEDEEIFVTRQEEERDPEAEAEFDREFEKMMAESMESRKFERKGVFDIPLPMKRSGREAALETPPPEAPKPTNNTMAFSLMTKKGNKQQVGSPLYLARLMTNHVDPYNRPALRLQLRCSDEKPAASQPRGTATDQEPGPQLRNDQ